jgi:hypothetical protein
LPRHVIKATVLNDSEIDLSTPRARDGRRDFDFLIGQWQVANRKLVDPLASGDGEWVEFSSTSHARSILDGLGNLELYTAQSLPGRGFYEGLSLSLYEPTTGLWRIWWGSTAQPGFLDTPMVGRFVDGIGRFFCDDLIQGRPCKVRVKWTSASPSSAGFEQAFSPNNGRDWKVNWIMEFSRITDGGGG